MDVRVGPQRTLGTQELMFLNYGAGKDSWESLGLSRRPNQSILKEISREYSLEGLMLKLKLQYFWPPDANSWLTGKDPDAGKDKRAGGEVGNRGWDGWMALLTQWTWVCANSRRQMNDREAWRPAVYGVTKSQTSRADWTITFVSKLMFCFFKTLSRFVIAFLPRSKRLLIS